MQTIVDAWPRPVSGGWRGFGGPETQSSFCEALAANLAQVRAPLLLQVPDHEFIYDLPDYVRLREADRPEEMYVFPDEYHVKYQPLHKLVAGERVIDWFRFWLKGEEDASPEKAEQYARWRALRQQAERVHDPSTSAPKPLSRCTRGKPTAGPQSANDR
jgi:hypothetical protein